MCSLGTGPGDRLQRRRFHGTVADCDVVFDTVGGEVQIRSYAVLSQEGAWSGSRPRQRALSRPRSDVQTLRPGVARDRKHLERMLELLEPARSGRRRSSATSSPTRLRHTGW